MFTLTLSIPWRRSLWITCSVMPTLRMKIFIAGSEFLCSRKSVTPRSAHDARDLRRRRRANRAHDSAYGVWNG